MTPSEQVVQQMQAADMPPLPAGHPRLDGKVHRFGPQKKGWYVAREFTLASGKLILNGAFGIFQGENRNTIKFKVDGNISDSEQAEYVRKQREYEAKEEAVRQRDIDMAANRAKDQWGKSVEVDAHMHPYLLRKQVPSYGLRVFAGKQLVIPMWSEGGTGARMMGLQKIDDAGTKLYNTGMDKCGAAYPIGLVDASPELIAVGEGYATCAAVHLVSGSPVVAAFDAGSIIHVARALRKAYPHAHLLFLADDDYLLIPRFTERLLTDFNVSCGADIAIDGQSHEVTADDGETVSVTAWWRTCSEGMDYIETDLRKGRMNRHYTYKNAGITACRAAAREVGNASVVAPDFANRNGEKWTDFNDLQVEQSLDALASQINAAVSTALKPRVLADSASLPAAQQPNNIPAFDDSGDSLYDQAVDIVLKNRRASISLVQRHLRIGYNRAARLIETMEQGGVVSAMQSNGNRTILVSSASPAPSAELMGSSLPAQLSHNTQPIQASSLLSQDEVSDSDVPAWVDDAPAVDALPPPAPSEGAAEIVGLVPLKWVLSHCALIQGTTDIWDAVNKMRIKKPAFIAMVGKDAAKDWDAHAERRSISPRNLPKLVRGVAKENGGAGDDGMTRMLDRYTLLYGTKSVWDADKKVVINFDAMALARGELAVRWLQHPLRLEKDHDKLVFDPTQKVDPDTHINMFEGFQIKPRHDDTKAALALRLLESLCSSEANGAEVFVWVLKWLAYPLQHPGAKMQTGLLFFGEKQGTGKSLFFEGIIKPIYGKHGATGGQSQLDAAYSAWRSQKLYVLFEEILSRQDKYSSFGLVKHLITGRDTPITQKFKDDRFEDNHLNVVMLSNEFQAVPIEPEDRRFQVVEAKTMLDLALLNELAAQLENGLVEAFYDFLLRYPLDGFGPHTKPIMTASKQRMIEFGRPDWEVFYIEWSMGGLSVPYCSCRSEHLFIVYERFCSRYHFRALSLKKFSELISSRLKRDRQWIKFGTKDKNLWTIFHVPSEKGLTNSEQCLAFKNAADIKDED
jgi:phage/plasmid primase-like uncharacterized protein